MATPWLATSRWQDVTHLRTLLEKDVLVLWPGAMRVLYLKSWRTASPPAVPHTAWISKSHTRGSLRQSAGMLWWVLIALAPTACDSLTSVKYGRSYEIAFSSYACCQPAAQLGGATTALGCANISRRPYLPQARVRAL
jgi:hypothetical protein